MWISWAFHCRYRSFRLGEIFFITDTLYPALANKLHRAQHPVGKHKAIQGLEHLDKIVIDQTPTGELPF